MVRGACRICMMEGKRGRGPTDDVMVWGGAGVGGSHPPAMDQ